MSSLEVAPTTLVTF